MTRLVVNSEKVDLIEMAFRTVRFENKIRKCDVSLMGAVSDMEITFGINWCACGTVTAGKASNFAYHLSKTAEMIERINEKHAIMEYGDETFWESKEAYTETRKKVCEMVREYRVNELIDWLFDGAREEEA